MNTWISNYIGWTAAIFFLVILPFLVRVVNDAGFVRLTGYCLLAAMLVSIFSLLLFSRTSLIKTARFYNDLSDRGKSIGEMVIRFFCCVVVIGGLLMLADIASPLFSYEIQQYPSNVESHVINHIDSTAMPAAFYIHMGIKTDDGKYLSFWYPDQILQTGHKYMFTILPGSDFVLSASPTD